MCLQEKPAGKQMSIRYIFLFLLLFAGEKTFSQVSEKKLCRTWALQRTRLVWATDSTQRYVEADTFRFYRDGRVQLISGNGMGSYTLDCLWELKMDKKYLLITYVDNQAPEPVVMHLARVELLDDSTLKWSMVLEKRLIEVVLKAAD